MLASDRQRVQFHPDEGGEDEDRPCPACCAIVAPASALPITTEERGIGATRISLRKPNSRSKMMLIALCKEEKMIAIAIMPGKTNCRYETLPGTRHRAAQPRAEDEEPDDGAGERAVELRALAGEADEVALPEHRRSLRNPAPAASGPARGRTTRER